MILDLREEIVEIFEFLPMPSVIFGVDLGVNGVFRAVRESNMSPVSFNVFLFFTIFNLDVFDDFSFLKVNTDDIVDVDRHGRSDESLRFENSMLLQIVEKGAERSSMRCAMQGVEGM